MKNSLSYHKNQEDKDLLDAKDQYMESLFSSIEGGKLITYSDNIMFYI